MQNDIMKTTTHDELLIGVRPFLRLKLLLLAALAIASLVAAAHAQPSFTPLGDLGAGLGSSGLAITPDGSMAVGGAKMGGNNYQGFGWTSGGGLSGIGYLPGGQSHSFAYGVNSDGTVIVGEAKNGTTYEAFRYSGGTMVGLGVLPGYVESTAYGVSYNGNVIVGSSRPGSGNEQAFRWNSLGGMVGLGSVGLDAGQAYSAAYAASGDGNSVVGYTSTAAGEEAFVWTIGGGMQALGVLGNFSGTYHVSEAHGISADGSTVVGFSTSTAGQEAFRWTQGGGMQTLGDLPGGLVWGVAYAATSDGSIIVGSGDTANGTEAFIWDASNGMRKLSDVLIAAGVTNLTGWTLIDATGISADGSTVTGTALDPLGNEFAFVAVTVPEPTTAALAGIGGLGFGLLCWRRRVRA